MLAGGGPGGDGGPPDELPAELAAAVGEFLEAWSGIERLGIDGWSRLCGGREPSEELGAALGVFAGELSRLELEDEVSRAIEDARARGRDR